MPVSNYAPELLELFRRAAVEPVRITLANRERATRLRFRLHNLRKEMRDEQHFMLSIAEGVQISIKNNDDGTATLDAHPADNSFIDDLRRAGIEGVAMPEEESRRDLPTTPITSREALEAFFKDEPSAPARKAKAKKGEKK